jgi:acyl-CoA oxidase
MGNEDGRIAALRRLLDGEHADIRDKVREGMSKPGYEPASDLSRDEHRAKVYEWTKELSEQGDPAMGFPREYGGEDAVGRSVAAFETLAFGDLSLLVKCGVQFGLFGGAVLHLGTERHHEAHLSAITSFELPGCFAMTETGHGSNVQELETTITYDADADELVVHTPTESARKDWIGNAARDGRMAAVFGQLIVGGEGRGVHAVLVPLRDEEGNVLDGIRIEDCGHKLGLNGVDNGRIWFDQVRVPRENLLDRYAQIRDDGSYYSAIENETKRFFTMLGTLIQGRVSICGASINAAKVAQVIAVRHALQRTQFGPPDSDEEVTLMEYRTHQRRLLPDLATTYALHFAQERLRAELHESFASSHDDEQPADRRKLETFAAGLKAIASWHAVHTIQQCREACGGAGYLAANRFAALKADVDVFTTFEGDNTVLLQLCAKNLLTQYRDQFGELDPLGMAQFFAGQAVETVAERTALREVLGRIADSVVPGRSDEEGDLLERETQLELVRWRQEHILQGCARRLRAGINSGAEPFKVLVSCQDHVVACARAWVDLVVLESFAEVVDGISDEGLRDLLDRVCSLYALAGIERERGWYQEHGRLSSIRSKGVIKVVNALCAELKDDAGTLVEAFGVPETSLGDLRRVEEAAR